VYRASEKGKDWEENDEGWTWKPSIHMPKESARIFLRVTSVRIERVQDISEADAYAEGMSPQLSGECGGVEPDPIGEFYFLWQTMYNNWNDNPWVWVIEFERIEKPEAQP
jgi:hypothetical protein